MSAQSTAQDEYQSIWDYDGDLLPVYHSVIQLLAKRANGCSLPEPEVREGKLQFILTEMTTEQKRAYDIAMSLVADANRYAMLAIHEFQNLEFISCELHMVWLFYFILRTGLRDETPLLDIVGYIIITINGRQDEANKPWSYEYSIEMDKKALQSAQSSAAKEPVPE